MACWLEVHGEAPVSGHRTRTPSVKNYKGPRYRTTPRQLRLCLHLPSPWASLLRVADAFRVTWSERVFVSEMHWPRDALRGLDNVRVVLYRVVLRVEMKAIRYSWFATTWQGGHVGGQNKRIFPRRIYMKINFSSQRREMLLFLTTNMAAVTSRVNQQ